MSEELKICAVCVHHVEREEKERDFDNEAAHFCIDRKAQGTNGFNFVTGSLGCYHRNSDGRCIGFERGEA